MNYGIIMNIMKKIMKNMNMNNEMYGILIRVEDYGKIILYRKYYYGIY